MSIQKSARHTPVPILLSEFPTPPSFIPPSPNPPPSLPPSLPLPPVPGPSPISDHDLNILSSVSRSRRASKISLASSNSFSRRDSGFTSITRGSGSASPNPSTNTFGRKRTESITSLSVRSVRSYASNSPLSFPSPSPSSSLSRPNSSSIDLPRSPPSRSPADHAIQESDEYTFNYSDFTDPFLTTTSLADIPRSSPSPLPPTERPQDDSISSIDMRDLPPSHEDDGTDFDFGAQAQALHFEMRAARSKSSMHKSRIRTLSNPSRPSSSTSSPTSASISSQRPPPFPHDLDRSAPLPPTAFPDPRRPPPLPVLPPLPNDRAPSPDIASIIASTPRPRRRSGRFSVGSRSRSQSKPRVTSSLPGSSRTSAALSRSSSVTSRNSEFSTLSQSELPYMSPHVNDDWNEESYVEDYGVLIKGGDAFGSEMLDINADLEADIGHDDDGHDSDSSIDLHTPLPNFMLRHGLLSPNSKLLPNASRATTPLLGALENERPGSMLSVVSTTITKSGIYKDDRDTVQRRTRHRDGKLLRGGIGLTTGLGWSDSEDEDSPSPLTRRLSSQLAITRKSSTRSLGAPTRSKKSAHPLPRSFSSDTTALMKETRRLEAKSHSSLPPTSWQKIPSHPSSTARSPSISEDSTHAPVSKLGRYAESASPHPVPILIPGSQYGDADGLQTPSSTSTASIIAPLTPENAFELADPPARKRPWDREKSLPPRPVSRVPSMASLKAKNSSAALKSALKKPSMPAIHPRISTGSDSSDSLTFGGSIPAPPRSAPPPASPHPRTPSTPRLLQLPASLQPGEPTQKSLLGYNRNLHDQQRGRAPPGSVSAGPTVTRFSGGRPSTPSTPTTADGEKPRPRTGTGMVYRRSSSTLTAAGARAQSRMRMPSAGMKTAGPIAF
ncbi:hypothetical protein OF83DRAFT_1292898 [Amylostereum chailletii]|nr:hypothetical protein OF83DRAFT_1292898 [Amylostereum chailletii]